MKDENESVRYGVRCFLAVVLLGALPASATTIGPDAFGYMATDATPYSFVSIVGAGTRVLANVDDAFVSAPLGFTFNFYGIPYSSVWVSSNGLITFGTPTAEYVNVPFSGPLVANVPTIGVLWDDWVTTQPGNDAVYYQTLGAAGSRQFVVQWNLESHISSGSPYDPVTYEAILFEGSDQILLQYLDVDTGDAFAFGASATVGLRDMDGNTSGRYLQWSHNTSAITNGMAIRIFRCGDTTVDPGEDCDQGPQNGTPGSCCTLDCHLRPLGTACRPAAGPCDLPESCTGSSGACPADAKSTGVCRSAVGACDVAESCDGVGNICPTDNLAAAGATCRSSTGPCDPAETCDGVSITCPTDQSLPDGEGDGACDQSDNCPLVSNADQQNTDGDAAGDLCDACPGDPTDSCRTITTVAGGAGAGPALAVAQQPAAAAFFGGRVFIGDSARCVVRRFDPATGQEIVVAGVGACQSTGDGGPATAAAIRAPGGVAVDASGNVYVATLDRVRRIDAVTHFITTVAGGGSTQGDGGPATLAQLASARGVALDAGGNLYVADDGYHRVRRVDRSTGIITTVAGGGGTLGDGGPATAAQLFYPESLAIDAAGNLLVADDGHSRIRRVDAGTGIITTIAGTGGFGFGGDGGPATAATLFGPTALWLDGTGNLFFVDAVNNRVRRIDQLTGIISTVAGTGAAGFSGDGGPATAASIRPLVGFVADIGLTGDAGGTLYLADTGNARLRRVDAGTQVITTVAGSGSTSFDGDGGAALGAALHFPEYVATDTAGNLYVSDVANFRVRRIAAVTRAVTTVAGNGQLGSSGDGGLATAAKLQPLGLAFDPAGNLLVVDRGDPNAARVRRVDRTTGIISTVAGGGNGCVLGGGQGDGGPATAASICFPWGIAVGAGGHLFIGEEDRVRRVDAVTQIVSTVAGGGGPGLGDGGPATAASMGEVRQIALDGSGNLLIVDLANQRVRRVAASSGIITTIAGTGTVGFGGDGGPATAASFNSPKGVAVDATGNVFVAESQRVRRIDATTGVIVTVAGGGTALPGDGGSATASAIDPYDIRFDAKGNLLIADGGFNRVRTLLNSCGDGQFDLGEQCDAGAANGQPGNGCDAHCTLVPVLISSPVAAGGMLSTAPGATVAVPVATAVTTPVAGTVAITQAAQSPTPPAGYRGAGAMIVISAPTATAAQPLALQFEFLAAVLPAGTTQANLEIFKDGVAVPACTGAPNQASPDPCVSARVLLGNGSVRLTVLTSSASEWFGARVVGEACGDGFVDAGEQCDDGNTADGDCCSSGCQFESIGNACAAGTCDGAGTCLPVTTTTTLPAQIILGKAFVVKDPAPGGDPSLRSVAAIARELASADTIVGNPLADGATLVIVANGATSTTQTFPLPAGASAGGSVGWKALGKLPIGYSYKDSRGANGPVKSATIKKAGSGVFLMKVALKGRLGPGPQPHITVVPPAPGTDGGLRFTINGGGTYCVAFGGAAGGVVTNSPPSATRNAVFKIVSKGTSPTTEAGCP